MLLVAAVAFLLAAGPGGDPVPGRWETNGPAYPAIDLIASAPDDESTFYAGAHDPTSGKSALFRSRDGGTSWETVAEAPMGETLLSFAIDPTGTERMLALTKSAESAQSRVYRSDDGGRSWRLVVAYAASDGAQVFFDPAHVNVAYFFSDERLRRSENDGAWTHVHFQSPLERVWMSPKGVLFWSAFIHTTVPDRHPWFPSVSYWAIFRSATQGLTSFEVSAANCPDLDSVVFAPSDPEVAYAASTACAPLWKSVDGGAHWNGVPLDDLTNLLGGLFRGVERIAIDGRHRSLCHARLDGVALRTSRPKREQRQELEPDSRSRDADRPARNQPIRPLPLCRHGRWCLPAVADRNAFSAPARLG
jgi:Sortilin, neurotensin receptor 3,